MRAGNEIMAPIFYNMEIATQSLHRVAALIGLVDSLIGQAQATIVSGSVTTGTLGDHVRVLTAFSPAATVPEPSDMALTLSGLACLGFILHRRTSTRA